jgi:hypothetical protein
MTQFFKQEIAASWALLTVVSSPEAIIASIVAGTSDTRHTRATAEAHKGAGALVEAVV